MFFGKVFFWRFIFYRSLRFYWFFLSGFFEGYFFVQELSINSRKPHTKFFKTSGSINFLLSFF